MKTMKALGTMHWNMFIVLLWLHYRSKHINKSNTNMMLSAHLYHSIYSEIRTRTPQVIECHSFRCRAAAVAKLPKRKLREDSLLGLWKSIVQIISFSQGVIRRFGEKENKFLWSINQGSHFPGAMQCLQAPRYWRTSAIRAWSHRKMVWAWIF